MCVGGAGRAQGLREVWEVWRGCRAQAEGVGSLGEHRALGGCVRPKGRCGGPRRGVRLWRGAPGGA